jgi:hypothetical protein
MRENVVRLSQQRARPGLRVKRGGGHEHTVALDAAGKRVAVPWEERGWTIVGTVSDHAGPGALIKSRGGTFYKLSAGTRLSALNQHAVKAALLTDSS